MKKLFLSLAFLPLVLLAQNITNTLGTGGTFIVENVSNASVFRATNSTVPQVYIGDWASGFSLPDGNVNMLFNNSTASTPFATNIVVGNGNTSLAKPTLNFWYTPGPLSAPSDVSNSQTLGAIGFGGYFNSAWILTKTGITAFVDGTPAGVIVPSSLQFTSTSSANATNTMTFDSNGNLMVPGGVGSTTSRQTNVNTTLALDDHVIICLTSLTVTLPSSGIPTGKTYIIKSGASALAISINGNGNDIDGGPSRPLAAGIRSSVTLLFTGSEWIAISGFSGW